MPSLKDILKDLPSGIKADPASGDVMADPDYVRQSSKFISDSLRKGQDVLQLDNGDIVTTEVKTVTTQYTWDAKKKKLVRATTRRPRGASKPDQK